MVHTIYYNLITKKCKCKGDSTMANSLPFNMTLKDNNYRAEEAVVAMLELSRMAVENGTADISLEEINAEINASRNEG